MKYYYTYIVECSDRSYYTWYTTSVTERIKKHNTKQGAKYTRSRIPVKLVYSEQFNSKSEALSREFAIKQLSRIQKEKLIDIYIKTQS